MDQRAILRRVRRRVPKRYRHSPVYLLATIRELERIRETTATILNAWLSRFRRTQSGKAPKVVPVRVLDRRGKPHLVERGQVSNEMLRRRMEDYIEISAKLKILKNWLAKVTPRRGAKK